MVIKQNTTHTLTHPNWAYDQKEEEYLIRVFGSRYLGKGVMLCGFCHDNHYLLGQGYCLECKESLEELSLVNPPLGNRFLNRKELY